ncbi:hypothetical protein DID88_001066 [Monilinia fructigena]|uniref:Uncharacterized protein n=1 Tax=Monilinia fructigena TaxID=38457 RepID=A0A395IES1_9HELO|nr:hypothetical protein DID88_002300 [Monilinia fructigena]RAL58242.1 hypothetical protein DID88_002288 [Monilinia fructigena]RAL58700.1 hypothetical protein DID88_003006 [Monilinia fructigena]RAL59219.1 hypothetical protein DID88_006674 [Monilinia fructigena]RAL60510.1 hypothetical protein DID88_009706 [Monilinia fructigena]
MPPTRTTSIHDPAFLFSRVARSGSKREPCALCLQTGRDCLVDEDLSKRCSACIRFKKGRCHPGPEMPSQYDALERQQEQLRLEEEKAFAESQVLSAKSQELTARILRLRRQQEFLRKREKEMIRRDLHTLEELDLAEENERLEKEKAEKEKLEKEKAGVPAPSDSSSFDFFDPSLPPLSDAELEALLADVGTSGGMPVTSQGS